MRRVASQEVCRGCFTAFPNPPPTICPKCRTPRNPASPKLADSRLPSIDADVTVGMTVLGGCGFQVSSGAHVHLRFSPHFLTVGAPEDGRVLDQIPAAELLGIEVGGPGTMTSGGGYVGGGFGITGFLAGAAAASILNEMTTKSSILTSVTVFATGGELHGFLTDAEPYAVRIKLAPVFTRLRMGNAG